MPNKSTEKPRPRCETVNSGVPALQLPFVGMTCSTEGALTVAFFHDLTPYTYFHPEEEAPGTINIGWLDRVHAFPTGETNEAFRINLEILCQWRVKQTRGFHRCSFCKGRERPASSSEMRVAGNGKTYAAPSLVYHYVVEHGYLPPDEFIAAVLAWR
jgi:hypothetical protein